MRLLRIPAESCFFNGEGFIDDKYTYDRLREDVKFEEFWGVKPPEYAIASHRWADGELTYDNVVHKTGTSKLGWVKLLQFFQAAANLNRDPPIRYIWIDTCCIDKTNSTELSEALNSM